MIFFTALRKELLEQWRSYRLLIVVVVLAAFGLVSPLTAKFMPELFKMLPNGEQIAAMMPAPTVLDAIGQYIKNSGQFALILALLMTMGTVAQEKDKGTAALMLVKPLPRPVFLAAKFVALGLTFLTGIVVAGAACYYYTWLLFEPLHIGKWLALNGLLLLYALVYIALTLLCSTMTRSQVAAGGLAVALLIVMGIVGVIPAVGEFLPERLLTWGGLLFAPTGDVTPWKALVGNAGFIIGALTGAWAIFRRQEL
jgi:ABC-2 type transport system permease protein